MPRSRKQRDQAREDKVQSDFDKITNELINGGMMGMRHRNHKKTLEAERGRSVSQLS